MEGVKLRESNDFVLQGEAEEMDEEEEENKGSQNVAFEQTQREDSFVPATETVEAGDNEDRKGVTKSAFAAKTPVPSGKPANVATPFSYTEDKLKSFMHWKFRDINIALKRQITEKNAECCTNVVTQMGKMCNMLDCTQKSAMAASGHIRDSMTKVQNATKVMAEIYEFADEALPRIKFKQSGS